MQLMKCVEKMENRLTEDELPTATEGDEWYYYADHVIHRIRKVLENGDVPEKGIVAWYQLIAGDCYVWKKKEGT